MNSKEDVIHIRSLQEEENQRRELTKIFIESYYPSLQVISRDTEILEKIFEQFFILKHFYGAFIDGTLAGIYALSNKHERSIKIHKAALVQQLGLVKGSLFYSILRKEFETPVILQEEGLYIEAVATRKSQRGKGIATAMMQHAKQNNRYLELEVADTNKAAIKLYEKLGFRLFRTKPVNWLLKQAGLHTRLYMNYKKGTSKNFSFSKSTK